MPRSLVSFVALLATRLSLCHSEVMPAVTSGVQNVTRHMNMAILRGDPGQTTPPLSEEDQAFTFAIGLVMWILVVTTVVSCNAWIEKPQVGCFSWLCCLVCPGGLFALCYPVDNHSTACGDAVGPEERRPMLGRGTTQQIAGFSETSTTQVLFGISGLFFVLVASYLAFAGITGLSDGCGTTGLSAALILKASLMFAILVIQLTLHAILEGYVIPSTFLQLGNMFLFAPAQVNLPDSKHEQIKLIMRMQKVLFFISAYVTFGTLLLEPVPDPNADACANGAVQTDAASWPLWGWLVLPICSLFLKFFGPKLSFADQRDLFVKSGHLLVL